MKKIIPFLITFIILLINCSAPNVKEEGSGNFVIQTPDSINPPQLSIMGDSLRSGITQIDTTRLNQDNFRYQVTVESRGKRLLYTILKRSDRKSISVIAGIPLDIYVSVYYAVNGSSDEELYNVFLASDSITDFMIMNGESKKLSLELDLTKKLPVDTYFSTNVFGSKGFGSITGADYSTSPIFSVKNYNETNSRLIYISNNLFTDNSSSITPIQGRGVVTKVLSDLSGITNWYIQKPYKSAGVHRSSDGIAAFTELGNIPPAGRENLENIKYIKSLSMVNGTYSYYFYFLVYNTGFFGLSSNTMTSGFTTYTNTDTSNFNNIYPADPFLLDATVDNLNNTWTFFATKAGLFYIDYSTITNYVSGNLSQAMDSSKKIIKFTESSNNVLITNVAVNTSTAADKKVYLGTKKGLYYIDRSTADWNNFINSSNTSSTLFNSNSITKLAFDEPVSILDIVGTRVAGYFLVASTPKRIYILNLSTGNSRSLTIWDGLPFIPAYGSNLPVYNNLEYKIHDLAPVNSIIFNGTTFWFATDFGLASIDLNKLGI